MNTENNKLIADFLNWKLGSDTSKENYHVPEQFWYWNVKQALDKDINLYDMDDHSYCHVNDMLFNVSFDWLMPVVEKIERTKTPEGFYFDFDILSTGIVISNAYGVEILTIDNDQLTSMGKMQAVYNACVGFIKWYNEKYNITYETN